MSILIKEKYIKTRKTHKCWSCGQEIIKGDVVLSGTSIDLGKIFTTYWCDVCLAYINDNNVYDCEFSFMELINNEPDLKELIKQQRDTN